MRYKNFKPVLYTNVHTDWNFGILIKVRKLFFFHALNKFMKVEKKTDVIELSIQSGPQLWKWSRPMFVLKKPRVYEGHLNTSSGTEFTSFTASEEEAPCSPYKRHDDEPAGQSNGANRSIKINLQL